MFTPTRSREALPLLNTILDAPFTTISGGQPYSPRNYDEKFEGNITLRRALAGSRNVPAVKLAEKVGIGTVVDEARRFGITTPLPPYLPLALGAADMKLVEHVSAFTFFRTRVSSIDPHMIRRASRAMMARCLKKRILPFTRSSPGSCTHHDAMLEEVIQFGTGIEAKNAQAACRRQNGNDTGLYRRLVRRFHPTNHCGRLGRF